MNCTFPPPLYPAELNSSSSTNSYITTASTNIDHQCWWNNNKNALIPFSHHQQQQPFNYPSLPSTSISAPIEWYPPPTKKLSPPSFEMHFQGIESMQQQRLALEPFYYPPTTTNFFSSSTQESFPSDPIPTTTNTGFTEKTQINIPTLNVEKSFEESNLSVLNEKELSKAAIKRRRRLRRQGGDKRLPRRRFEACWGNSNYSIETTTTTMVGLGIFN